jgi:hypothetical protein
MKELKKFVVTSLIWFGALSVPVSILAALKSYHNYYMIHAKKYKEALGFLETTACLDSGIRASLGEFNLCDQSEERLRMWPILRAFYDLIEDLSVCGHGRCWVVIQMFTNSLPWLIITSMVGSLILYKCIADKRYRDSVDHWRLPENGLLLKQD